MALCRLPAELLTLILEHVGSDFFQADIRRLTVSKVWATYATAVLYRDLRLTQVVLDRLAQLPETHPLFAVLREHVRSLRIPLLDTRLRAKLGAAQQKSRQIIFQPFISETWAEQKAANNQYIKSVNQNLETFGRSLGTPQGLTSLRVDVGDLVFNKLFWEPWALRESTLAVAFSSGTLTSLHLDLHNVVISHDLEQRHPYAPLGKHLCTQICGLLPHLVRLRLRLNPLCPALLSRNAKVNPNLKELILNMNQHWIWRGSKQRREAQECPGPKRRHNGLRHILESRLEVIAGDLKAPECVRILYSLDHDEQGAGQHAPIRAFDAVTGRRIRLRDAEDWAGEGDGVNYVVTDDYGLVEEPEQVLLQEKAAVGAW